MGRHKLSRYAAKLGNHPKIAAATASVPSSDGYWAADILRRFDMIFQTTDYRTAFFDAIDTEALAGFMQYPPLLGEPFQLLYSNSLLPTPEILNRVMQGDISTIENAKQAIKDGKFDLSNPLHVELEYSRHVMNGSKVIRKNGSEHEHKFSFETFRQLPWVENQEVVLTDMVYSDISRTARDAAAVFEFIVGKQGVNPLLVIGNKRYGSNFVVNPIEGRLSGEGIKVAHEHISSFTFYGKNRHEVGYISPQTWQYILESSPDVVIVDGTKDMEKDGLARFPAAMIGYSIQAFETSLTRSNRHR